MSRIPFAALVCHQARTPATLRAMERVAGALVGHNPTLLVLVSRREAPSLDGFCVFAGELVDEARRVRLPAASAAAASIEAAARQEGLAHQLTGPLPAPAQIAVPLRCLIDAGWRGDTAVVSFPSGASHTDCQAMGRAIARAALMREARLALVITGELGRQPPREAPDQARAAVLAFDEILVTALRDGRLRDAVSVEPALRRMAAEDVIDALEIAAAALDWDATGHQVLSYEAPHGVGHLVAMLHDEQPDSARPAPRPRPRPWGGFDENPPFASSLASIAREAICARLAGRAYRPPLRGGDASLGVFVALRTPDGRIRVARGSMGETQGTLVDEIVDNALAACNGMTPLVSSEMAALTVEIAVLRTLEPIDDLSVIHPAHDGILVEQGKRRGAFLPHLLAAETAEEQLRIACEAGRIDRGRPFEMYRMVVDRLVEPQADS